MDTLALSKKRYVSLRSVDVLSEAQIQALDPRNAKAQPGELVEFLEVKQVKADKKSKPSSIQLALQIGAQRAQSAFKMAKPSSDPSAYTPPKALTSSKSESRFLSSAGRTDVVDGSVAERRSNRFFYTPPARVGARLRPGMGTAHGIPRLPGLVRKLGSNAG